LRFWVRAEADPDHVALIDPTGVRHSAGELLALSRRVGRGLRDLGMQPGDAVAAVLPNSHHYLALYLAVMENGFYLVPVNSHLVQSEVEYLMADSGVRVVVGDAGIATLVHGAAAAAGVPAHHVFTVGSDGATPDFADLAAGRSDAPPPVRRSGEIMYYTGGTTGKPKGIRRPLPGVDPDDTAVAFGNLLGLLGVVPRSDDVHLCGSPLYHTAVLAFTAAALHGGQRVVLLESWSPARMLETVAVHGVTNTHMVPTQFHRLLALPDTVRAGAEVGSLRYVIHGAAPCPKEVKARMLEWWGPIIYEYYGSTEGGGTVVDPKEWLEHPGTVGRPWPGADIRILDDDAVPCPPSQPGTVYIKLGQSDFEYHGDQTKTAESRREGYFTVGDIGYFDDDGYLFLCDRKADLVISGGVNIYPAEVEAVILGHGAVGDVAVFGIPHADLGESVHAVIEPAAGVAPDDALIAELRAFCADNLALFKTPRSWELIERLPRDPSGKLFKRTLREKYWHDQRRAI
jgi:long-chain acyl-CoA synthetase